ncbi:hypothetical protein [Saccharicrinis sp. FJH54]|uniref:hypothetical protein n=1 Tax=Saccharicrinis sp. FJH54 TaxID=3344665 RepID=UPI0035D4231F
MRSKITVLFCAVLATFAVSCTQTYRPVKEVFSVPFQSRIIISDNGDGSVHISGPVLEAGFNAQSNVSVYELRIVREDGLEGDAFTIAADKLVHRDGRLFYVISGLANSNGMDIPEADKDKMIEIIQNDMDDVKVNYKALEVGVYRY